MHTAHKAGMHMRTGGKKTWNLKQTRENSTWVHPIVLSTPWMSLAKKSSQHTTNRINKHIAGRYRPIFSFRNEVQLSHKIQKYSNQSMFYPHHGTLKEFFSACFPHFPATWTICPHTQNFWEPETTFENIQNTICHLETPTLLSKLSMECLAPFTHMLHKKD